VERPAHASSVGRQVNCAPQDDPECLVKRGSLVRRERVRAVAPSRRCAPCARPHGDGECLRETATQGSRYASQAREPPVAGLQVVELLEQVLEDAAVVGAVRAGAIGYMLKSAEAEKLRKATRAAAARQVQIAPEAAARLMREVRAPELAESCLDARSCVSLAGAREQEHCPPN
jgi:hypothetical protein